MINRKWTSFPRQGERRRENAGQDIAFVGESIRAGYDDIRHSRASRVKFDRGAAFDYGTGMTAHPARFWLGLLAGFVLVLWLLRHILLPFVLGMAVAYLLDPLVNRLARRGIPRAVAAGVIVVGAYGA